MTTSRRRLGWLAVGGVLATVGAYVAALYVGVYVQDFLWQSTAIPDGMLKSALIDTSRLIAMCLLGGLVQAMVLSVGRLTNVIAITLATAAGSTAALAIAVYAWVDKHVYYFSQPPFSNFALFGFHSRNAGALLLVVTICFTVVGLCQAAAIAFRAPTLAAVWPGLWLLAGLAYPLYQNVPLTLATRAPGLVARVPSAFYLFFPLPYQLITGAVLGLLCAAWVLAARRVRTPRPFRLPAPLVAGTATASFLAVLVGGGYLAYQVIEGPVEDPSFFCQKPDTRPASSLATQVDLVLDECAAGTTVKLKAGQTIGIDLQNEYGVDTGWLWSDPTVSDRNILDTVQPPHLDRTQEQAVYRARTGGQVTVTDVFTWCSANVDLCNRGVRWTVTIVVT